ncbi:hypothetical protein QBC43DRAFT_334247 [Cladorrhinum sp. PSN259]|nr:hypothetical protein QBC43DRAFT_334247 [Cladorrhinum sp. PSN259]
MDIGRNLQVSANLQPARAENCPGALLEPSSNRSDAHGTIATQNLGKIAEFLARKPRVSVPGSVLRSGEKAIELRKTFSASVQANRKADHEDRTHQYFIQVLEFVRNALGELPASGHRSPPRTKAQCLELGGGL